MRSRLECSVPFDKVIGKKKQGKTNKYLDVLATLSIETRTLTYFETLVTVWDGEPWLPTHISKHMTLMRDDVGGSPKITCPGARFGICGGVVWGREAAWSIPNIFMSHFFRLYFHDSRTQNTFQFYYKRTMKSANDYTFSTWLMGCETEHTYFASDFLLPFCSSYSLLITYATSECQSIAVYLFLKSTFEDVGFAYACIERLHLHKSPIAPSKTTRNWETADEKVERGDDVRRRGKTCLETDK